MKNVHRTTVSTEKEATKQAKFTDIFIKPIEGAPPKSKLYDEKFILARRIALWHCRDLLPYSCVENIGFKDFWKSLPLHTKLELPTRQTVSISALDDMYGCLKTELIEHLKNIRGNFNIANACIVSLSNALILLFFFILYHTDYVTLSFDSWTDNHKHISYNTYILHYVTQNGKLQSRVLKTSQFEHPHTGERIRDDVLLLIQEYGLESKKIVCVTDGAANMAKAIRLLHFKHIICIAHSTNNLIKDTLKHPDVEKIGKLLEKIRKAQRHLLYRYEELKKMHDKDNQNRLFLLLNEFHEMEQIYDAEIQFGSEIAENNDFSGLKSVSNVRWNCVYLLAKGFLEHSSKFFYS